MALRLSILVLFLVHPHVVNMLGSTQASAAEVGEAVTALKASSEHLTATAGSRDAVLRLARDADRTARAADALARKAARLAELAAEEAPQ